MGIYQSLLREEVDFDKEYSRLCNDLTLPGVVDKHGVTPGSLGIMRQANFLSSASVDAIGVEAFRNTEVANQLALESVTTVVTDKAAAFAARIVAKLKEAPAIIQKLMKPFMDKFEAVAEELNEKLKDKTFGIKQTVKAHPYKTAAAAVASLAALTGVLAMCGSSMPGGNASRAMYMAFFGKVADGLRAIPWPFHKVNVKVSSSGSFVIDKLKVNKALAKEASNVEWNKSAVKYLLTDGTSKAASFSSWVMKLVGKILNLAVKAVPNSIKWANKFRRTAPSVVHAVTRSEALGHVTSVGLTIAFYVFLMKMFWLLTKIVYEVGGAIVLFFKSIFVLFL